MMTPLWSYWRRLGIVFNWQFGLALILLFGIPRFFIVLQSNMSGNNQYVSIIFLLMWVAPWVLLTKQGRRDVGIRSPRPVWKLLPALLLGITASALVYGLGSVLYGSQPQNWLVYIARSYPSDGLPEQRWMFFLISAGVSMLFSPIGEELLYRGLIHDSFAQDIGNFRASLVDSSAFALTHLAHFGFLYLNGSWTFAWLPALLWVGLMFLSSRLFYGCRVWADSIWGAVCCHAGFNLGMAYFIYFYIL
jgi:membrane protease YdiL (CAAX protease family)